MTDPLLFLNEIDGEIQKARGDLNTYTAMPSVTPIARLKLRESLALAVLDVQAVVDRGDNLKEAANRSRDVKAALHAVLDHALGLQKELRQLSPTQLESGFGLTGNLVFNGLQVPEDF